MLVLAGAGGYLLWRVNQDENLAPDDSEATGGIGACCGTPGCVAGWKCDTTKSCSETKDSFPCSEQGANTSCPSYKGATATNANTVKSTVCGKAGQTFVCNYSFGPGSIGGKCVEMTDPDPGDVGGTCPDKIKACEWPSTIMSSTCSCEECKADGSNGCSGKPPTCTPGSCPSGYESCGDSVSNTSKTDSSCKASTVKCVVYHPDCNNPSNIYRYCKPKSTSTNTCDGGAWVTKPTGVYKHCDAIAYSATATDSDGIKESSITAKLNSTARTSFSKNTSGTTTTISETLSSSTNCLVAGSYTLDLSWEDTKGATSTACALTTTFTVQAEETNPDWTITKNAVEVCKDENTENPTSELTYTITLKNIGDGEGTITKIVDTLDPKVLATYISNISDSGAYASGAITWTPTDTTFATQEQRTYTYKVTVPKDAFGKYANTVTAYPSEGESLVANAEITADCVIEAPDTGIFDSTWSKIIAGVVLIAFGISYNKLVLFSRKLRISVLDIQDEARKKNFEKKVVKK